MQIFDDVLAAIQLFNRKIWNDDDENKPTIMTRRDVSRNKNENHCVDDEKIETKNENGVSYMICWVKAVFTAVRYGAQMWEGQRRNS